MNLKPLSANKKKPKHWFIRYFGLTVIFPGIFITILTLKLTNTINWPWLWVTAPLWIPATIFIMILAHFLKKSWSGKS